MTFIETATEDTAAGTWTSCTPRTSPTRATWPTTRACSRCGRRPGRLAQLNGAIMHGMDLRRYELVTLAAARARAHLLRYGHGRLLRDRFYDPEAVRRIATTKSALA